MDNPSGEKEAWGLDMHTKIKYKHDIEGWDDQDGRWRMNPGGRFLPRDRFRAVDLQRLVSNLRQTFPRFRVRWYKPNWKPDHTPFPSLGFGQFTRSGLMVRWWDAKLWLIEIIVMFIITPCILWY